MSFKIRRIIAAVADGSAHKAVKRAAQIAGRSKAQLELFSVVRPVPPVLGMTRIDDPKITSAWVEARRRQLEKLARPLRDDGIAVTCTVIADFSATDAIVRRARQSTADLVAIEAHKHSFLARLFLSQHDFDLIRECPMPLLIVKGSPRKPKSPVLAALDPWHVNAKPKALDGRIVEVGRAISQCLGAPLHSGHAYSPLVGFVADPMFAPSAIPISPLEEKKYVAAIRRNFRRANAKYRISPRRAHLQLGDPALVLPDIVRALKAQLLVMGAISRSAVKRILIGNTAERVLDSLPCDVLIVKPESLRN
jgi:universal stress protein E